LRFLYAQAFKSDCIIIRSVQSDAFVAICHRLESLFWLRSSGSFAEELFELAMGRYNNGVRQTKWMIRLLKRADGEKFKSIARFIISIMKKAPLHCYMTKHYNTTVLNELFLFGKDHKGDNLPDLIEILRKLSAAGITLHDIELSVFPYLLYGDC